MPSVSEALGIWIEDLFADQAGLRVKARDCLYAAHSPFQRIAVFDTQAFGKVLCLGGTIALTELDEPTYSEHLVHPALAVHPAPKRVLVIGGGDGGVARECLRHAIVERVTVVEIDLQVVEISERFFPGCASALKDPRCELVIDDAHRWLKGSIDRFDVIIVDASEFANSAGDAFHGVSFADAVLARLNPGGILVAPLGSPVFEADACRDSLRTLATRFPHPHPYLMSLPSFPGGQWAVAWCSATLSPSAPLRSGLPTDLKAWSPALQPALFTLPGLAAKALRGT
jgi:spermidine synthase